MSQPIPTVEKYMTAMPYTIGVEQPLAMASKLMFQHQLRHLPVLLAGHLVGLLSARELALVESLPGIDPQKVSVEEAMAQQPFSVAPERPLDEVVREMALRKFGAAVIVKDDKVVGILTMIDVCKALAETLHRRAS